MMALNGILPVDKPIGPTSHDVVAITRRTLGLRRIGHTGTLDPFASGLLLLCLGPSTRLAEYLTSLSKQYIATIRLGAATDTDDSEGSIISSSESWRDLDRQRLEEALASQTGDLQQIPARYSAKKVAGERMYDVARRGGTVELQPVAIRVHRLQILEVTLPDVRVIVDCSSGTYIRAIARDVGQELGVGGHLVQLRRTQVGEFKVEQALTMDDVPAPDKVERALLSPRDAVRHLTPVHLTEDELAKVRHGGSVDSRAGAKAAAESLALLDPGGELIGIGEQVGDRIQPRKVFA